MHGEFPRVVVEGDEDSARVHLPNATHAPDYVTLCGLDGFDDGQSHTFTAEKVTCEHCIAIWKHCKRFSAKSFDWSRFE